MFRKRFKRASFDDTRKQILVYGDLMIEEIRKYYKLTDKSKSTKDRLENAINHIEKATMDVLMA